MQNRVEGQYTMPSKGFTGALTLPMLRLLLFKAKEHVKSFENHLNPVMLIFIG